MKSGKKKRNQGSSLMFIIVAVAFVSILATIILRITLINVETKDINRKMQKNRYSTESVMDQVTVAIQNISADQLRIAYSEMLSSYTSQAVSGDEEQNNIQKKFAKTYLNKLIEELSRGTSKPHAQMAADGTLPSDAVYDQSLIRGKYEALFNVTNSSNTYISNDEKDCNMELHYNELNSTEDNYLLLKNIKVKYKDGNYATTISTDIKLSVPKINFEGGSIYPDFTKFCLIGDERVETNSGYGIGNVYGGEFGININGDANFGGGSAKIITRGDIMVNKGASLEIGSKQYPASVWTENYMTVNPNLLEGTAVASLTVYGDSYVHDDLALNSSYSKAVFNSGNYYGYTFNKDNTVDSRTDVDSQYSSAILINGKNSSLTMKSTDNNVILLGGRAFISRAVGRTTVPDAEVSNTDIMMGQSIATKSDQSFMLVDDAYLTTGYSNPMPVSTYQTVSGSSIMTSSAKKALKNYLNSKEPVTCYFYKIQGSAEAMVYFYYNFKSQKAADQFFQSLQISEVKRKALNSDYLRFGAEDVSGIKISPNLALFTFGNMYTFDDKSEINKNTLTEPQINSDNDDFYKDRSIQMSAEYKSYQLKLNDSDANKYNCSAVAENEDDSGFNLKNKEKNRVFHELMTYDDTRTDYAFVADAKADASSGNASATSGNGFVRLGDQSFWMKCVGVDIGEGKKAFAVFVADIDTAKFRSQTGKIEDLNNETSVSMQSILSKMKESEYGYKSEDTVIIASNCNIVVDESVKGLVLSAHTVKLSGASVGATAQSAHLQAMFSKQKSLEATASAAGKFMTYFTCFSTLNFNANQEDTNINIVRNVSYVNWKKNEE